MSDDELRRRLHDLPGPGSRIDTDAVVAGAKRRRRPKVAALNAAAAGVGVLIIAPFVVPGLSPIAPTSVLSEQGAAQPAPEEESGEDAAGAAESGAADSDSVALACSYPALVDETGIRAAFLDDPADGIADLELTPSLPPELRILGVAVAQVAVDGDALTIVAAPDLESLDDAPPVGASDETAVVEPGSTVFPDSAVLDAPAVDCGFDAPSVPAPLLLVELDGQRIAVVGDPFGVR